MPRSRATSAIDLSVVRTSWTDSRGIFPGTSSGVPSGTPSCEPWLTIGCTGNRVNSRVTRHTNGPPHAVWFRHRPLPQPLLHRSEARFHRGVTVAGQQLDIKDPQSSLSGRLLSLGEGQRELQHATTSLWREKTTVHSLARPEPDLRELALALLDLARETQAREQEKASVDLELGS